MKGNLWWMLSIVFLLAGCDKELMILPVEI